MNNTSVYMCTQIYKNMECRNIYIKIYIFFCRRYFWTVCASICGRYSCILFKYIFLTLFVYIDQSSSVCSLLAHGDKQSFWIWICLHWAVLLTAPPAGLEPFTGSPCIMQRLSMCFLGSVTCSTCFHLHHDLLSVFYSNLCLWICAVLNLRLFLPIETLYEVVLCLGLFFKTNSFVFHWVLSALVKLWCKL